MMVRGNPLKNFYTWESQGEQNQQIPKEKILFDSMAFITKKMNFLPQKYGLRKWSYAVCEHYIWLQFVEVGNELFVDFSVVFHSNQSTPCLTRKLSAVSKRESVEYYLQYVHNRGARGGAPCFGRRTISFLVKFESSVLCTLLAYIGHLGYFLSLIHI